MIKLDDKLFNNISKLIIVNVTSEISQSKHLLDMGIKICNNCSAANPVENRYCKYCNQEIITITHENRKERKKEKKKEVGLSSEYKTRRDKLEELIELRSINFNNSAITVKDAIGLEKQLKYLKNAK